METDLIMRVDQCFFESAILNFVLWHTIPSSMKIMKINLLLYGYIFSYFITRHTFKSYKSPMIQFSFFHSELQAVLTQFLDDLLIPIRP